MTGSDVLFARRDTRRDEATAELRVGHGRRIFRVDRVYGWRGLAIASRLVLYLGRPPQSLEYAMRRGLVDGAVLTAALPGLDRIEEGHADLSIAIDGTLRAATSAPVSIGGRLLDIGEVLDLLFPHTELWSSM